MVMMIKYNDNKNHYNNNKINDIHNYDGNSLDDDSDYDTEEMMQDK